MLCLLILHLLTLKNIKCHIGLSFSLVEKPIIIIQDLCKYNKARCKSLCCMIGKTCSASVCNVGKLNILSVRHLFVYDEVTFVTLTQTAFSL